MWKINIKTNYRPWASPNPVKSFKSLQLFLNFNFSSFLLFFLTKGFFPFKLSATIQVNLKSLHFLPSSYFSRSSVQCSVKRFDISAESHCYVKSIEQRVVKDFLIFTISIFAPSQLTGVSISTFSASNLAQSLIRSLWLLPLSATIVLGVDNENLVLARNTLVGVGLRPKPLIA